MKKRFEQNKSVEDEKEKSPSALIQLKSNLKNIDFNSSNNTSVPAKVLAFLSSKCYTYGIPKITTLISFEAFMPTFQELLHQLGIFQ
jgi:hypothetical protein